MPNHCSTQPGGSLEVPKRSTARERIIRRIGVTLNAYVAQVVMWRYVVFPRKRQPLVVVDAT
jgi:hypothetical protein